MFPQHMFLSRYKKNIDTFWLKKVSYQELCIFVKPFILADEECAFVNSVDRDEMAHQDLHCFQSCYCFVTEAPICHN